MQNITGCKINVSQPSGRDIEREIGLIGSRSAIEHAKHVILEKVRAVEEKNRAGGKSSNDRHNSNDAPYNNSPNAGSSNYNQGYNYGQQQQQSYQAPAAAAAGTTATPAQGSDPYAAYGGYENYMAIWSAFLQNQGQGQSGPGAPAS